MLEPIMLEPIWIALFSIAAAAALALSVAAVVVQQDEIQRS
jgi:hypothetical protein